MTHIKKTGLPLLLAATSFLWLNAETASAALTYASPFGSAGSGAGQLSSPSGIATDPSGNVYVADGGNSRVEEFAPTGAFVRVLGGPGELNDPQGIAVDSQGNVFVANTGDNDIVRLPGDGGPAFTWGSSGSGAGQFAAPTGIAVDDGGDVYVADSGNDRIEKFTNTGAFLTAWGAAGTAPGQFATPTSVASSPDGTLYVADSGNDRVERFTATGGFVSTWGTAGSLAGEFSDPLGVAVSPLGSVYVADTDNDRVQQFTLDGAFLGSSGAPGPPGTAGQFNHPSALAFDPSGNGYITDTGNNQIQHATEATQLTLSSLPPPTVHQTVNVQATTGTVLVREPGSHTFQTLTQATQIRLGSTIDTRHGVVTIASRRTPTGPIETIQFYGGVFRIQQPAGPRPATQAVLTGGSFSGCGVGPTATDTAGIATRRRSRRVVRSLWGSGVGHYQTVGHDGSAAVNDPRWLTEDRCDGTLFVVKKGTITVRDFVKKRTVVVHAPGRYLATARL